METTNGIRYAEQFNEVIDYIENHLDEGLNLERLAKMAGISKFHFHRLFKAYYNESIGNFQKRIRLEAAARSLIYTNKSIKEITYSIGYDSQSAFSQAFKNHFGSPPSIFKKHKIIPIMDNKKQINTISLPEAEIRQVPDRRILFLQHKGDYASPEIGRIWNQIQVYVRQSGIYEPSCVTLGITHDDPSVTAKENCRYDAAITIMKKCEVKNPFQTKIFNGGKYAVFTHYGSYDKLEETYNAIFTEWLPSSSYTLRDAPPYDAYLNSPMNTTSSELKTEIHIPVS